MSKRVGLDKHARQEWLIHFVVQQKLTQNYKAPISQFKKKFKANIKFKLKIQKADQIIFEIYGKDYILTEDILIKDVNYFCFFGPGRGAVEKDPEQL